MAAGLPVELTDDAGLPFPMLQALRLAGQAQFDPTDVLLALRATSRPAAGRWSRASG